MSKITPALQAMRNAVSEVAESARLKRIEIMKLDSAATALESHLWDLRRGIEMLEAEVKDE